MADNYDKRFSEDAYATKEDVADTFNVSSVDFIWNQVVNYRKRLTSTLELPSIDRTKFCLVFTQSINNRILAYERMLNKVFYQYNSLSDFGKKAFREKRMVKILSSVSAAAGAKQTDSFLLAMVENTVSTIPIEAIVVDNYMLAVHYLETHDAGPINYTDFNGLYVLLSSGSEPLSPLKEKQYRKTSFDEPHYYQKGFVYKAALIDRIDEMMDSLSGFMNDDSQFATARAIAALYYCDYVMPYEYLREQMACLAFKLTLSRSGFASFASFIDIESLELFKDAKLAKIDETVQRTFDITYFFDYVLGYLNSDVYDILDDLAAAQKEEVSQENKSVVLSNAEKEQIKREGEPENLAQSVTAAPSSSQPALNPTVPTPTPAVNPAVEAAGTPSSLVSSSNAPAVSSVQIYGKTDVALPIFPAGLQQEDIDKIAIDLMETYPTLRKTQAHFYASHCTIGRSYTIQEFKKCEDTSYETARTSMDYLAQLGFYEKAQVRNKFVYRPIPRR